MILTCPKCQAQYKLDAAVLGVAGRDVRCVSCSHTWFQIPETAVPVAPAPPQESPAQMDMSSAQSITDALQSILEKDGAAFDEVLSTVVNKDKNRKPPDENKPAAEEKPDVPSVAPAAPPTGKKPETLPQETVPSIITHNPAGMGANAFGGMIFLFLCFLTLTVMFAAKKPILDRWPQTALFYRALGFHVPVAGEGLKFSGLSVERRIDDSGRTLVISAQMANTTSHAIAYPPLRVILKAKDGTVVKSWDLKTGVTQISGGDIVPVMMQLDDVPENGSTVELRVKGK